MRVALLALSPIYSVGSSACPLVRRYLGDFERRVGAGYYRQMSSPLGLLQRGLGSGTRGKRKEEEEEGDHASIVLRVRWVEVGLRRRAIHPRWINPF